MTSLTSVSARDNLMRIMSTIMKNRKDHAGLAVKDDAIRGWTKRMRDAKMKWRKPSCTTVRDRG